MYSTGAFCRCSPSYDSQPSPSVTTFSAGRRLHNPLPPYWGRPKASRCSKLLFDRSVSKSEGEDRFSQGKTMPSYCRGKISQSDGCCSSKLKKLAN